VRKQQKDKDVYKISHVSTTIEVETTNNKHALISTIVVDVFKSYQDPDNLVTFKVEHMSPKRLFDELKINLN
jgi:hypothetical protein